MATPRGDLPLTQERAQAYMQGVLCLRHFKDPETGANE